MRTLFLFVLIMPIFFFFTGCKKENEITPSGLSAHPNEIEKALSERIKLRGRSIQPKNFNCTCDSEGVPIMDTGSDGLYQANITLPNCAGEVTISYQMYTLPDRIDIFYNNTWVKGSGSPVSIFDIPRSICFDGAPGFVSGTGTFTIQHNPNNGNDLKVFVSGCEGGTAWDISVSCPKWYEGLPDCPCKLGDLVVGPTQDPEGEWNTPKEVSSILGFEFHYGATTETRWSPKEPGGPGQQCTYDEDGLLITSGIAAGSPDLSSPQSTGSTARHFVYDVLPWFNRPCHEYLNQLRPPNSGRDKLGNVCPANPINDISDLFFFFGDLTCNEIIEIYEIVDGSNIFSNEVKNFVHGIENDIPVSLSREFQDYMNQVLKCDEIDTDLAICLDSCSDTTTDPENCPLCSEVLKRQSKCLLIQEVISNI